MERFETREKIRRMLDPEIELRNRLFQLLSAIGLCEFILVTLYTVLFGGGLQHSALMIVGTAAFALSVSLTFTTGKLREGTAVSSILYFLLYMITFDSSGGMYGGSPVTFVFALVYVFLVTQKTERVVIMAAGIAGVAFCYVRSYLHPEILDRHSVMAEHSESFTSVLLVTALLCTLFAFVTKVYAEENHIVNEQKARIEKLNQTQKKFFSSMSHEIRTPVNAISGLNEVILRADIPDEVREDAESIEAASRMLLHTIGEILDASRLETDTVEIIECEYDTAGLVDDIEKLTRLSAEKKGLSLTVERDAAMPARLCGDEMRIRKVLLNLLANAIKYTKQGGVCLKAGGCADGDGSFRAVFEVEDSGIGIREEDIPYLFTAYARMDEEANRHIEGTGLGLAIVNQLTDMMGGSISVSSEYGKGSVFRVEIPQKIPAGRAADGAPAESAREKTGSAAERTADSSGTVPELASLRVLAVDDTRMNLMVLKKLLRGRTFLDTAESGEEALGMTLRGHYDVILMDHQMPGMDGVECMRRIKAQDGGLCRDSRMVCLTANAGPDMEQLYISEGFDAYLSKPVRGEALEKVIAGI